MLLLIIIPILSLVLYSISCLHGETLKNPSILRYYTQYMYIVGAYRLDALFIGLLLVAYVMYYFV